jgi:cytochrome c oxidase subunit 2
LILVTACAPVPSLDACPPRCPYTTTNTDTFSPASVETTQIQALFNFILITATVIFVVVEGLLVYAVLRFRGRPPESAVQIHGNTRLEIAWTTAPAIILAVLLGFTLKTMGDVKALPTGSNVLKVKAIGHQWWWEFRYPDFNIITANEFVVPLGSVVDVEIESVDVEHGFWAPELFGKADAVPGYTTRVKFTPLSEGAYGGQCTQFCGTQHAEMRFAVLVKSGAEFQAWAVGQQQAAAEPTGAASTGRDVFMTRCIACHTIQGLSQIGQIGPNLTHLMSRNFIAGGILPNTPEQLAVWLKDPQQVKSESNMILEPPLTEQEIDALVAFLTTLK